MERSQPLPRKSSSFSHTREERLRQTDRNFSLGAIRSEERKSSSADVTNIEKPQKIDEGGGEAAAAAADHETPHTDNLNTLAEDIDRFLAVLNADQPPRPGLPEIPSATIDKFVALVEKEVLKYESGEEKLSPEHHDDQPSLLDAVDHISRLTSALVPFSSDPNYLAAVNLTGTVLHHAMSFLEDEFYSLLEESSSSSSARKQDYHGGGGGGAGGRARKTPSFSRIEESDRCVLSPTAETSPSDSYPSPEIIARLRAIANAMVSAGHDAECFQVFAVARRNALSASLSELGYEKIAIDDIQRMPWDAMETEIGKWSKAFRYAITTSLPLERDLCDSVFAAHRSTAASLFHHLAFSTILSLLNFPEALAMTRRSAEKLFKVLDVYETLKEMAPKIDLLFPNHDHDHVHEETGKEKKAAAEEEEEAGPSSPLAANLKSEMSAVQARLGEAAVTIFCDLESSIRSDTGRNAVPGGAVHPLTRYVMNYLKLTCEYIGTLEHIFKEHNKSDVDHNDESNGGGGGNADDVRSSRGASSAAAGAGGGVDENNNERTPFSVQLALVMELLQANLDSKAKLYKDPALSNIFLMNNGRYIVQKIKGSGEIKEVLGDNWCRKRSSELRQYHNNYKRETWSKVLACFKDEGLTVKGGSVLKPVLKERFKSFNAMFEEIHKTQSMWVVSDEQMQSELRVSVSAVVVPAYRSFLGRFQQYLDPGRQTEKYIKFGPEDLETYIDELFDGNPSSLMARRR